MDLLRKSRVETELNVVDAGDKVEAETEAFATTPITLGEDAPYLEPAYDVLNVKPETGQGAVGTFFFIAQRMMLAGFGGQEAVGV